MNPLSKRIRILIAAIIPRSSHKPSWETSNRPSFTLALQCTNGNTVAFPWSMLEAAHYEQSDAGEECITLTFTTGDAKIRGLNIAPMLSAIASQQLKRVWSTCDRNQRLCEGTPFISNIAVLDWRPRCLD